MSKVTINDAIEYISARPEGVDTWVYYAEEIKSDVRVTTDYLQHLAHLMSTEEESVAYSLWCAESAGVTVKSGS